MRKLFSILLIFSILFSTVGVTVAEHFCMSAQKKIEIEKCCRKCDDNCCKNEFKVYKLNYETIINNFSKIIKPLLVESFVIYDSPVIFIEKKADRIFSHIKPPPLILFTSELSFIKVFLI
ncbi:MAG: hypothetical protein ACHQNT_06780 [Bacteroidia bacterium]